MNFFSGHNMANEVLGHMSPLHKTDNYLARTCPSHSLPMHRGLIAEERVYIPYVEPAPLITHEIRAWEPVIDESTKAMWKYQAEQSRRERKLKYSDEDAELARELLESGCGGVPFEVAKRMRDEYKHLRRR
ncbi:MAG: hypothetical protein KAT43_03330 [Nanoarchaeota archaeon]|nr:hypothetical protein [Nanoarchaeota archaeon]